ncbi:hypothetical protein [Thiosulfativibrio zosterae]|uniref:Uncharacterized protein n=1 Tax=Thiosulfativibrio zosterae TaxID=2675053 RepID=A0A6F8PQ15_9GAMM|nr:hypothetical protein [Thiosulfativibrio zosterae]BBP44176.1 hypothetical protein THMIRHAT_19220 [Thiosulfativibrio zosterae]
MNNRITAKIPFYFKGVEHTPSTQLNLDDWAKRSQGELPDFCSVIAQENGIGSYSYELEVMESSEIVFEDPQGLAVQFYNETEQTFDFEGFKQFWLAQQSFGLLNTISQQFWGKDLVANSVEHQALMAAFVAGKND